MLSRDRYRVVVGGLPAQPLDPAPIGWRQLLFRTKRATIAYATWAEETGATTIRIYDQGSLVAEKRPAA